MTRFQKELSGELGAAWQKAAYTEMASAKQQFETNVTVDENGAAKWTNVGRYIMDDMAEMMEAAGCNFSRAATTAAREAQNSEFIAAYKAKQQPASAEQMYEMQAAFGKGTTVVNVLSGQTYKL